MTTVLDQRSPSEMVASLMAQNISQNFPSGLEKGMSRGRLEQGINQIKQLAAQKNMSPQDIVLELAKYSQDIPERAYGPISESLTKLANARAQNQTPLAGEESLNRDRSPIQRPEQRQPLPNLMNGQLGNQSSQNFPTNIGPQEGPGNAPQEATTGEKVPLLTPQGQIEAAHTLSKQRISAGIPTTPQQALQEIQESEKAKKEHNLEVDKEAKNRVISQKQYGERAVDYLKKFHTEATPEQETIFQKIGEETSTKGKSEAEINRSLSKEAEKFKNRIVNIEKDLDSPRLQNSIQRAANGTYKDLEQSSADAKRHIQPLLDMGLYDTARNILSKKGYGPEEREMIVNPMSDRSKTIMNRVIKIPQASSLEHMEGKPGGRERFPRDLKIQNIKSGLTDLKNVDPNFSLVLARKAFEDKGYDWREYKDALNQLEEEGRKKENGFKLEDDQETQRGYLDTPPLSRLEQLLHGLNIIGR